MTIAKVLFAGLGSIGQRHLRNLRTVMGDAVEILAFRSHRQCPLLNADMSVVRDAAVENAYHVRSFAKLDDALAESPDAVFVTNPNTLHLPVALAAAKAGCHLFIEKPLSHSLDGVDELIECVERRNLTVMVGYQFRFHPGLRWIKSLLDDGRLGRVVSAHIVNGEYLPGWHPYEDYRTSHAARRELGGGALRIQCHELDYAAWLFGMPNSIYAAGGHLSSLEVNVEDSVDVLMTCQSGARAFPVHVHLDYLQRPPQRICEIIGDHAKVRYDYYANEVRLFDTTSGGDHVQRFPAFERNQMFMDELAHFLHCVQSGEKPCVDLREAKRSLSVTLGAVHSLESGAPVACKPD